MSSITSPIPVRVYIASETEKNPAISLKPDERNETAYIEWQNHSVNIIKRELTELAQKRGFPSFESMMEKTTAKEDLIPNIQKLIESVCASKKILHTTIKEGVFQESALANVLAYLPEGDNPQQFCHRINLLAVAQNSSIQAMQIKPLDMRPMQTLCISKASISPMSQEKKEQNFRENPTGDFFEGTPEQVFVLSSVQNQTNSSKVQSDGTRVALNQAFHALVEDPTVVGVDLQTQEGRRFQLIKTPKFQNNRSNLTETPYALRDGSDTPISPPAVPLLPDLEIPSPFSQSLTVSEQIAQILSPAPGDEEIR